MMIPIDEDETVTWVVAFQPMQLKVNPLISPSTFFLNVTCQILMIPYGFVLCGQPPHVNSQLRISVEEPESTAMTSSRMTVTTRGS